MAHVSLCSAGRGADGQASPLTWSNSQQRQMEECPRARYWAVEMARQGWRRGASALAMAARRLKTLRSLDGEIGRVLHERAAERANAIKAGEPMPSLARMRQQSSAAMNFVMHSSRHRREHWLQAPDQVPMLADVYYGTGPTREQIARARERLERGLVTLHQLGLWAEVAAADPRDIVCVDARQSYLLPANADGPPVTVWAAPDLTFRPDGESTWVVCDHKSGRVQDGRSYRQSVEQVTTYVPMLRHGLRVVGPEELCRGRLILLGDGSEAEWAIIPEEIDAAERRIRAGAQAMAALRVDADAAEAAARDDLEGRSVSPAERLVVLERARRTAYPMTSARSRCRYCPYRELCAAEQAAEAAAATVTEEVA